MFDPFHVPYYCIDLKKLTRKAPKTTMAEFANTVDPDETAHNEPSHERLIGIYSVCPLVF